MRVALVIGGTGMLAELTYKLSEDYAVVGVVARNRARLEQLATNSDVIKPISVDYSDTKAFDLALSKFVEKYGKVHLVVYWVHIESEQLVTGTSKYCDGEFYEITGTSGREANHISHQHEKLITSLGLNYHRVILGSIDSRWLTNHEISIGVYTAIHNNMPEYIVGE